MRLYGVNNEADHDNGDEDDEKNKNGHILPTGQWYAPSAVKMMH